MVGLLSGWLGCFVKQYTIQWSSGGGFGESEGGGGAKFEIVSSFFAVDKPKKIEWINRNTEFESWIKIEWIG